MYNTVLPLIQHILCSYRLIFGNLVRKYKSCYDTSYDHTVCTLVQIYLSTGGGVIYKIARCIDLSFPMTRSNFLQDVQRWEGGISISWFKLVIRLGERESVPVEVLIIHPGISLDTLQSPSHATAFFRLMESFISPGLERYMDLSARNTILVRRCCCTWSPYVI